MQVLLIILSVGLLGVIIYFVFSPKSSRLLKLSSLIALGLIALSVGICAIFLIRGPKDDNADIILPIFQDAAPAKSNETTGAIWVFIVFLLALIGLVVYLSMREKRINLAAKKNPKPIPKMAVPDFNTGDLDIGTLATKTEKPDDKETEDSFDIDFK